MINYSRLGLKHVPFKTFSYKLFFSFPFILYPLYKFNQTRQRKIFMKKIRDRNEKLELELE